MAGGARGDDQFPHTPPSNGGEFLLSLLQRPSNPQSQSPSHLNPPSLDPAVAAVGPSISSLPPPWPSNAPDFLYPVPLSPWSPQSVSTPIPPHLIGFQHLHNAFPPPRNQFSGGEFTPRQSSAGHISGVHDDDLRKLGFRRNHDTAKDSVLYFRQHEHLDNKLQFGSLNPSLIPQGLANGGGPAKNLKREPDFGEASPNGSNINPLLDSHVNSSRKSYGHSNSALHSFRPGEHGSTQQESRGRMGENYHGGRHPPTKAAQGGQSLPGFSNSSGRGGHLDPGNFRRRELERGVNKEKVCLGKSGFNDERASRFSCSNGKFYGEASRGHAFSSVQLDRHGRHSGSDLHSVSPADAEGTVLTLDSEIAEGSARDGHQGRAWMRKVVDAVDDNDSQELDNIGEQLVDSLLLEDEPSEKSDSKHIRREKDCRGNQLLTQRVRFYKRQMRCRGDIDMFTTPLLSIYESLIPPKEEKDKQMHLLTSLEKLVVKEWSSARLCLFGSCANSFGFSNSDIDVCLVLGDADIDKSEIILKLADILQSANLQNVQALTRARVPIVKLKDPETGISCDICVNNVLAVVNTKLLRDYAKIDVRLQQLAFIVKHWAKSRGVNETYQGTLSSYAYVLMCIHFLQHRRPAILPCLQEMKITYRETVDNIECAYFDQVEKLQNFGSNNNESIAQLVWGFFNYWAYGHDYANSVISVRTGSIISKRAKEWTRRVGNDRHLICIEDPFETSHDLGRVVDKYSIKVLREEFERAAEILQMDPNPTEKLFEPFIHT